VGLPSERASAARRLLHACFAEPLHVAGEVRLDTIVLRGLAPSCFVKGAAEGVHCAALPKLGLGIALKIDDGAKRAAELVMSELLAALLPEARQVLADQLAGEIQNWKGVVVGRVAPSELLRQAVAASPLPSGRGE
jgi:L-asparaginase II